ncbi:MAG: Slp family lipoprotein, partial [Desulfobacterales bacterium]|nr:Slp family lipoprotein [Desulfobacterales bacterium]
RDFSEGRFQVVYSGFLDPEVYRKDRRVTVAGTLLGCEVQRTGDCPHPLLRVAGREIYLWPEYEYRAPSPYPYYDPWYSPFRYHRYYYHPRRYYR